MVVANATELVFPGLVQFLPMTLLQGESLNLVVRVWTLCNLYQDGIDGDRPGRGQTISDAMGVTAPRLQTESSSEASYTCGGPSGYGDTLNISNVV